MPCVPAHVPVELGAVEARGTFYVHALYARTGLRSNCHLAQSLHPPSASLMSVDRTVRPCKCGPVPRSALSAF